MLNQKSYDPKKVDLWSCGIVLYTMLCGYLPFEHENTAELYRLVGKGEYDQPQHLSVEAKDLLKKMMAIDPEDRPSLNQIRKHPFCRTSIQPIIKGLLPNEIIQIEPQFIEQMKAMGYSGFIKDIEQNAVN